MPKPFETIASGLALAAVLASTLVGLRPATAGSLRDFTGQWDLRRDEGSRPCRITLNGERSDKGDFFVGVPMACRHAMPLLVKIGRWSSDDPAHLALSDPAGQTILALSGDGDTFTAQGQDGASYRMVYVPAVGRSAMTGTTEGLAGRPAAVIEMAATKPAKVSSERSSERMADLAGRYAVLRDKTHDTGCMLTLDDKTRVKGGARAALAPACRDQGIVVFDPSAWQIVNGRLVLTAKAGHVTHLDRQEDGSWLKDAAEGKSLSLKKL